MRAADFFFNGMLMQKAARRRSSLAHLTIRCTGLDYSSIFFCFNYVVIGGAAYMFIKDCADLKQDLSEMADDLGTAGESD